MTAKRILLVVPSASSVRVFLREVAEAWVAEGGCVDIATAADLPGVTGEWPRGAGRIDLPPMRSASLGSLLRTAWRLRQIVKERRPHMVHAHFGVAAIACALARTGVDGAFWMATFHGLHGGLARPRQFSPAIVGERWAAARMDQVWVLNREDREYLLARGLPAAKVGLQSGVGCDLQRFDRARFGHDERERIRLDFGLPAEARVIVFVGRQVAFKGFDATVRAFWLARERLPNLRLLLVGTRDEIHPSGLTAEEERRLETDTGILSLGWRQDVAPCLAVSDLCVFPSQREGMPVNLMEALAMGVPVITSNTRGCRDVVRDGVDGCALAQSDVASVARGILELIEHPVTRAEMSRNALAGRMRFARQLFVDEQIQIYRHLLPSSRVCAPLR